MRAHHHVAPGALLMTAMLIAAAVPATAAVPAAAAVPATAAQAPAARAPAAEELLARTIAYHDPQGLWATGVFRLQIAGTRPLAGVTMTTITLDNAAGRFSLERVRNGRTVTSTVIGDHCDTRLDGSKEYTPQDERRFGLSCEAMLRQRNYHLFLYGLPMKTRDPGARLDPEAQTVAFEGRDVWRLRLTYDPAVGTDTWYFFLDQATYALVGYRFYHDEAAGDGETIILDREIEGAGLRLPKVRSWLRNTDGELLGTDVIQELESVARE